MKEVELERIENDGVEWREDEWLSVKEGEGRGRG